MYNYKQQIPQHFCAVEISNFPKEPNVKEELRATVFEFLAWCLPEEDVFSNKLNITEFQNHFIIEFSNQLFQEKLLGANMRLHLRDGIPLQIVPYYQDKNIQYIKEKYRPKNILQDQCHNITLNSESKYPVQNSMIHILTHYPGRHKSQLNDSPHTTCDKDPNLVLPEVKEKSIYKSTADYWTQKKKWPKPIISHRKNKYIWIAEVWMGPKDNQRMEIGEGRTPKEASYEAFRKLLPQVMPFKKLKHRLEFMSKKKSEFAVHPKTVLHEMAVKRGISKPVVQFSATPRDENGKQIWTCQVSFCGNNVSSSANRKKKSEHMAFQLLLTRIQN